MTCCKCGHIRDLGGLELGEWAAKWNGVEVCLPPAELRALKRLTAEPGKMIHWTQLSTHANARMIISRLMRAFRAVDPGFHQIAAVRGSGGWRWRT